MDYISLPCSQKYHWGQVTKALNSPMLTSDDISAAVRCYRPTAGKFVTLDYVINEVANQTKASFDDEMAKPILCFSLFFNSLFLCLVNDT